MTPTPEEVTKYPWTFKEGTLREKLEWAREQHRVNGTEEAMRRVDAQSMEQRADFHRGCVKWYVGMLEQLAEVEAELAKCNGISGKLIISRDSWRRRARDAEAQLTLCKEAIDDLGVYFDFDLLPLHVQEELAALAESDIPKET